jgi:hypothetical protein
VVPSPLVPLPLDVRVSATLPLLLPALALSIPTEIAELLLPAASRPIDPVAVRPAPGVAVTSRPSWKAALVTTWFWMVTACWVIASPTWWCRRRSAAAAP